MNNHPTRGYFKPIIIKGIPVMIHWSFPAGGIFLALFLGDTSWRTVIPLILAYTSLVLIHELGHAFAAKLYSLKVHALLITAAGGWCYADNPTSKRAKLLFFGGGLIAQLILLAMTITMLSIFGNPPSLALNSFVLVYTIVNIILLVINIYPSEGTDGKHLWEILREIKQNA